MINQAIDIVLWSWVLVIMIKRVICRGFDITIENIVRSYKEHSIVYLVKSKLKSLLNNHHYYSDILLLLASLLLVCEFSNRFYLHSLGKPYDFSNVITSFPRMIVHKFITISILLKYKRSQPKVFRDIAIEFKTLKLSQWLQKKQ